MFLSLLYEEESSYMEATVIDEEYIYKLATATVRESKSNYSSYLFILFMEEFHTTVHVCQF